MVSFIFSLEIIKVVIKDPNIFLWIFAFALDAAAVNPNGVKTVLADDFSTFPIKAI